MADLITSFSDAELHDLEDKAEAAMAAALDAVMEVIASRIERNARPITSAADDGPAKEPGQPYVSPDDLASIGPLWDEQVQQRLMPMVAQVYQDSAGQIHASLVDAVDLPDLPAASSLAAETYLAGVQNVYRNVGTDLWSTARTELQEGFKQGESIDELAARVRGAGKISARNAELVARSTVIEASNAGSIATARASGLDMQKEWINTHDARTRPTHQDEALGGVGGQRVDLNAQFTVGGFSADAPGDPTLPPQEKYRCRCTVGYVMGKRDVAQAHTEARQQTEQQTLPNTVTPISAQPVPAAPSIAPVAVEPVPSGAEVAQAERVARRRALRESARAIQATRPYANFAAEVDQAAAASRGQWTPQMAEILSQRAAFAESQGVAADALTEFRTAVDLKDLSRAQKAARRLASEQGLQPIGRIGGKVAYDPETMEALTEAGQFEAGDVVQVWRQGYTFASTDGKSVLINRAVVRAPSTTARSSLIDLARSASGEIGDPATDAIMEGFRFEYGGLRTAVDRVEPYSDGSMGIYGQIFAQDGSKVGVFNRVIHYGDVPPWVHHKRFGLVPEVQGSGFASAWNQDMYDWYRASGFDRVQLTANIDVGGYAWATQGFDFATDLVARQFVAGFDRSRTPEQLATRLGQPVEHVVQSLAQLDDLVARVRAGEHVTAYEFSQVGRLRGQGGKDALWLGKFLMLNFNWLGTKAL